MWNNNSGVLLVLFLVTSLHCRQVCQVAQSKLGEGYNIQSADKCREYCDLVPQCLHWTWYRHHCPAAQCGEEDFVKNNICYALTDCHLVEEQCSEDQCQSGHKNTVEDFIITEAEYKPMESLKVNTIKQEL